MQLLVTTYSMLAIILIALGSANSNCKSQKAFNTFQKYRIVAVASWYCIKATNVYRNLFVQLHF